MCEDENDNDQCTLYIAILQPTLAKILEKLELTTTTTSPASTTGTATHQNHMDLDNFATQEDTDQIDLDDNEDGKSIEIEEPQVINNNGDREAFYEVMNQNLSTTKRLAATTTDTSSVEKALYSFQPKHKTTQEKQQIKLRQSAATTGTNGSQTSVAKRRRTHPTRQ
ncbi:unnamed protein product [Didymodactylos carnosus]|uniref:Uncharacterized protein n=1 Tax=Didymodactylos carnosus TaxID=1234261 RepID=A0A816BFU0_9BILA|nr:unnamed protein product [Didymodactylos carnosus]CAF1609394.1 unnamed protein product [Didymodactylos carnosus]CAF4288216.1 unnamed protein product [Didymodactylos carnosus]CAF4491691.1 unnamed protein product [Didymodactylos carnosus]